jgi:hypothetical protein
MNTRIAWLACGFLAAIASLAHSAALTSKFTYQGQLKLDGSPVNATAAAGTQVGSTLDQVVTVTDGVFSTDLDFGAASFDGQERWLEISVRSPAGSGAYTTLTPRQLVTAAPYALQTRGLYVSPTLNVGIGTTSPQNALHILRNADTLALEGTDHSYMEFFPDGSAAGRKAYFGFAGAASDNVVLRNETPAGHLILGQNGNVGIGLTDVAAPTAKLQVNGSAATTTLNVTDEITLPSGTIRQGGTAPATTDLGLFSLGAGNWLRLVSNNGPIQFFTNSTAGTATTPAANTSAMTLAANGNLGLGTTAPTAKLDVHGDWASIFVTNNAGATRTVVGHNASTDSGYIQIRNSTNQTIAGFGGDTSGNIFVADAAGQVRAQLSIDANGRGISTSDIVVITGGSDIAEPYDVAAAGDVKAEPGMVVSIDPQKLGCMRVCDAALDRKVAGIISGANGVRPGLIMRQEGSVADGSLPVAASGRVWCLVDADAAGAIKAGDMLTTSGTPGHAMRVKDSAQATGAIIGKAMSELESGRGYVLVLVSLQ